MGSLPSGARLGAYEIVALIGAGGMGEVYRARDTRLNRDVAIKVLPEAFVHDTDRLSRFKREAQVLELVEGPTLADRISQGAIPVDEALPIARQIADALKAAHEHGIIHCDLKPANIKLTGDGNVKVLDFGLAKAAGTPDGGRAISRLSRRLVSIPNPRLACHDGGRRHSRHRAVHESRAGEREICRQAHRHLGVRLRGLRDAHRQAGVRCGQERQ